MISYKTQVDFKRDVTCKLEQECFGQVHRVLVLFMCSLMAHWTTVGVTDRIFGWGGGY